MIALGIETSCDETAAAVVRDGRDVLSNIIYTQIAKHQPYGGVVPEIASRCHVDVLPGIVEEALKQAGVGWSDIDLCAVTRGPGLASSLLVGMSAAKALSLRLDKPLVGVNHLHGHLFSVFLGEQAPDPEEHCPMVALLVSGGHSCLIRVENLHEYVLLGETLDDAAGEALDKGASLLGLSYPGGPAIQKAAEGGDPQFIDFPRGLAQRSGVSGPNGLDRSYCFSFSGLKTALRYYVGDHPEVFENDQLKDVAASYEEAVVDALSSRLEHALREQDVQDFACVGGVARNKRLRARLSDMADRLGKRLWLASPEFCTDNAAMVAALASSAGHGLLPAAMDLDVDPNLAVGCE